MSYSMVQTDTAAQDSDNGAICSSGTNPDNDPAFVQCSSGGTPGSTDPDKGIGAGTSDIRMIYFQSAPGEPNATTWEAGTWTIPLNINTADTGTQWTQTWVCRVDSSGASQESLGSTTGQTEALSAGVHNTGPALVSCSAATSPSATDEILIILVFTETVGMGANTISFFPDQTILTPIGSGSGSTPGVINLIQRQVNTDLPHVDGRI